MPIVPLAGPLNRSDEITLRRAYKWIVVGPDKRVVELLTDTIRQMNCTVITVEEHIAGRKKIVPVFESLDLICLLIEMLQALDDVVAVAKRYDLECLPVGWEQMPLKERRETACANLAMAAIADGAVAHSGFWEYLKKIAKVSKTWKGITRFNLCRAM